jgi:hypothetical protein
MNCSKMLSHITCLSPVSEMYYKHCINKAMGGHYAISRKVAGLIPDEVVGFAND